MRRRSWSSSISGPGHPNFGKCPVRVDFAASVAKDAAAGDLNEDCFEYSPDGVVVALSDGASESFDSRTWAAMLCKLACSGEGIAPRTVTEAVRQYSARYDPEQLSWSKAAAYEKGSFATLLCLRHDRLRADVEIVGIGDTVLVLCDGQDVRRRFPLTESEHFQARPELLSTRDELNVFVRDPLFNTQHVAVEPVSDTTIALMLTDALGHWCYRSIDEGREDWRFLLSVASEDAFREFVSRERADRRMKLDDTTLVRATFEVEG